ncbi:unnamed protein product [Closterium sp. NIES-64]|nr:unnamed protein product [Closterium sp. NIES-64]
MDRESLEVLPASELSARYELIDMLGEGQYGTVWRCEERDSGRLFACKHISLTGLGEKGIKAAVREIEVMATLSGNRNVVSLQGIYEDADSVYLNPLRARSRSASPPASPSAASASTTMPSAKLADFGLSLALRPGQRVVGYAGSFPYEAPEVLANKAYDQSADIFSLGVTLYAMLSGTWPAFHRSRCLDDAVDWELPCWRKVSEVAKDLIRWMVSPLPHMRPTVDEVLAHPWFALPIGFPAQPASPRSVVRTFRTWRRERSLKQEEERQAAQRRLRRKFVR